MRYQTTAITGGAAADASPSTSPTGLSESRLFSVPERLPGTDAEPQSVVLGLTGTAGNTAVISIWACLSEPRDVAAANRKWCITQSATVTVGTLSRLRVVPGLCYVQVTTATAADSILSFGVSSASPVGT
jgi:hypothetical protein